MNRAVVGDEHLAKKFAGPQKRCRPTKRRFLFCCPNRPHAIYRRTRIAHGKRRPSVVVFITTIGDLVSAGGLVERTKILRTRIPPTTNPPPPTATTITVAPNVIVWPTDFRVCALLRSWVRKHWKCVGTPNGRLRGNKNYTIFIVVSPFFFFIPDIERNVKAIHVLS